MDSLKKLITICNEFKEGAFSLAVFQSKIETILLPDACKNTLEKQQHNVCNHLEKIIYFFPESEHKERSIIVANELLQAALSDKITSMHQKNRKGEFVYTK